MTVALRANAYIQVYLLCESIGGLVRREDDTGCIRIEHVEWPQTHYAALVIEQVQGSAAPGEISNRDIDIIHIGSRSGKAQIIAADSQHTRSLVLLVKRVAKRNANTDHVFRPADDR